MPTAKVFQRRNQTADLNEDVDSSEILIPESLTDFTSVDVDAERGRSSFFPLDVSRMLYISKGNHQVVCSSRLDLFSVYNGARPAKLRIGFEVGRDFIVRRADELVRSEKCIGAVHERSKKALHSVEISTRLAFSPPSSRCRHSKDKGDSFLHPQSKKSAVGVLEDPLRTSRQLSSPHLSFSWKEAWRSCFDGPIELLARSLSPSKSFQCQVNDNQPEREKS